MEQWKDTRFAPPADLPPRSITVGRIRKDGKFMVTYFYPVSGRHIRAIRTTAQLLADERDGYQLLGTNLNKGPRP
jgi:hypothetical protein